MHSMYGNTILKPIEADTVVKTLEQRDNYISLSYNFTQSGIQVGDKY